ncbi:hypothetical protein JL106_10395 [Nakamurella sp. YIM 132084]|uniref:Signal transduction histidine-protein kinase/phosphatase MprB n=1 Tax=Nakamurella leprariae TaxID=2803911 RepID=A0A938YH17_9ACTN|nr:hypothetical protein [Nakamurella leprariae]
MRRRVLLSTLLAIAATVLTLGVPLGFVSWRVVDDLLHRDLSGRLAAVNNLILDQVAGDTGAGGADPVELDVRRLEAQVPSGGRLDIRMAGRIDQSVGPPLDGQVVSEQLVMSGGGLLRLSVPESALRSDQITVLALVVAAIGLSGVVGTGVALLTARRLVTPLTELAGRAARLGAGDFRTSGRRYQIGELDRVAEVLDQAAADIAALIGRERDLAGDISHQLRTRLTGIRLRLEELSMHPDPEVVQEVQAALDQTDHLVTVVDDLLAGARSQRAGGAHEVVLDDLLAEVRRDWRERLAEVGRRLEVVDAPAVRVHATAVRLREALGVLIDNALQHGQGRVTVQMRSPGRAGPTSGMVVLEVTDEGSGVADGLVGHVFDRGVSTASSTGIGLGLARAFLEADGGRLELTRARPPVFAVFLPPWEPTAVGERDQDDAADVDDMAGGAGRPSRRQDPDAGGSGSRTGASGAVVTDATGEVGASGSSNSSYSSSSSGKTNRR